VTTHAKKIANPLVITTLIRAKRKVFPRAMGKLASVKAATQPLMVHAVGWPGRLATKLFTKSRPMG
jgi:hypothetical protein